MTFSCASDPDDQARQDAHWQREIYAWALERERHHPISDFEANRPSSSGSRRTAGAHTGAATPLPRPHLQVIASRKDDTVEPTLPQTVNAWCQHTRETILPALTDAGEQILRTDLYRVIARIERTLR